MCVVLFFFCFLVLVLLFCGLLLCARSLYVMFVVLLWLLCCDCCLCCFLGVVRVACVLIVLLWVLFAVMLAFLCACFVWVFLLLFGVFLFSG